MFFSQAKNYASYTQEIRKKPKGAKDGEIMHRENSETSKGSSWLVKEGGRDNMLRDYSSFPQTAVSEVNVIKENYSGQIYSILAPENVTKTRIFKNDNEGNGTSRLLVGSKFLDAFTDTEDLKRKTELQDIFCNLNEHESKKLKKDIFKVRLISAMLGETDFEDKLANSGFLQNNGKLIFKKIDHGESLSLNVSGKDFYREFTLKPPKYSAFSFFIEEKGLDIDDSLIWEVIDEITSTDIHLLKSEIKIHEDNLTEYRKKYGSSAYCMLGDQENLIGNVIIERFECLVKLNNLKKNIDASIINFDLTFKDPDMKNPYLPLLKKINSIQAVDQDNIEKICFDLQSAKQQAASAGHIEISELIESHESTNRASFGL